MEVPPRAISISFQESVPFRIKASASIILLQGFESVLLNYKDVQEFSSDLIANLLENKNHKNYTVRLDLRD